MCLQLRIWPDLVFGRLWKESGIQEVIQSLLQARRYEFDVERAVYLTVLHRLFASNSDRGAERWREDYLIPGAGALDLHPLYRAMAFLGQEIGPKGQKTLGTPPPEAEVKVIVAIDDKHCSVANFSDNRSTHLTHERDATYLLFERINRLLGELDEAAIAINDRPSEPENKFLASALDMWRKGTCFVRFDRSQ